MSKRPPRSIWVADSETDPFLHGRVPEAFIWGCYNGEDYHEFDTVGEFVDFIREQHCIIYAHNGGKFDWHFLLDKLEPFAEVLIIEGRVSKFVIGEAEFRDSWNILPFALAKWQKDDFDYRILERSVRNIPANRAKIKVYLRSDCINLYTLVTEFQRRFGRSLTVSGAALKYWRTTSGAQFAAPESTALFYNTIAPYYYGGRVQVFEPGIIERPFIVVDINGAYADAMKRDHPYGQIAEITQTIPLHDDALQRSMITVYAPSRGFMPYRDPRNLNALCFPDNNVWRSFTVTGWEYLAARECGHLDADSQIIQCVTFSDMVNFGGYIDEFAAIKTEAKRRLLINPNDMDALADYLFAKLLQNILYGKMASNPDEYQEHVVLEPEYLDIASQTDGYNFAAYVGKNVLASRPIAQAKKRFLNVATAASITGFVRAKMARAMVTVDTPIYCDTDSFAANNVDSLDLHPTRLGAWDIEAECIGGAIAGKKMYAFDRGVIHEGPGRYKTATKGVRLNAQQIYAVAAGESIDYKPAAPTFSIRNGIYFNDRSIVSTEDSTARLHRQDVEIGVDGVTYNP